MSEAENINGIVSALGKVPEARLKLVELANRLKGEDGQLQYDGFGEIQGEINVAVAEARAYVRSAESVKLALRRLPARVQGER